MDHAGDAWAAGGKIHGFGEPGQPRRLADRAVGTGRSGSSCQHRRNLRGGALVVVGANDVWAVTGSGAGTAAGGLRLLWYATIRRLDGAAWVVSGPADGIAEMVAKGTK